MIRIRAMVRARVRVKIRALGASRPEFGQSLAGVFRPLVAIPECGDGP